MNILVDAGIFGVLLTDENTLYGFYIVKFPSTPYTIQEKTATDGNIISSGERVVNADQLTILRHETKLYMKYGVREVIFILQIIVNMNLNVYMPACVDGFPEKYVQNNSVVIFS